MTGLTTLAEKINRLGTLMGRDRIQKELGLRVLRDGTDFFVEFLKEDGTVKARQPCSAWSYNIQQTLFHLADDLASQVADMATTIRALTVKSETAAINSEQQRKWAEEAIDGSARKALETVLGKLQERLGDGMPGIETAIQLVGRELDSHTSGNARNGAGEVTMPKETASEQHT